MLSYWLLNQPRIVTNCSYQNLKMIYLYSNLKKDHQNIAINH